MSFFSKIFQVHLQGDSVINSSQKVNNLSHPPMHCWLGLDRLGSAISLLCKIALFELQASCKYQIHVSQTSLPLKISQEYFKRSVEMCMGMGMGKIKSAKTICMFLHTFNHMDVVNSNNIINRLHRVFGVDAKYFLHCYCSV